MTGQSQFGSSDINLAAALLTLGIHPDPAGPVKLIARDNGKDYVRFNFMRTSACGKYDHSLFFKVANGTPADKVLSYLSDADSALNADLDASFLDSGLQSEGIHQSAEHAHLVGYRTVVASRNREVFATNECASAHNDSYLDAQVVYRGYLLSDLIKDLRAETKPLATRKGFTAEFK